MQNDQSIRLHLYLSFKCMNINIGRIYRGMSKSFGHGFDVRAVRKKKGCAGMSQSMKLQMTDTVPFQKVVKLFCRSLRIHHMTIVFRKHIISGEPFFTEQGDFVVLHFFIIRKNPT